MRVGPGDLGSAGALAAAVRTVAGWDPAPDAVLVSGDLAEHGAAVEYARVRELLEPLAMPVHVLAGNHDDVDELGAAFGPCAWAVEVAGRRLVGCDTTVPGRDDGRLDLEWLAALVERSGVVRRVVAGHVHRAASGVVGGCLAVTCPSVWRQSVLDLAGGALALSDDPPGFLLHTDAVAHVQSLGSDSS